MCNNMLRVVTTRVNAMEQSAILHRYIDLLSNHKDTLVIHHGNKATIQYDSKVVATIDGDIIDCCPCEGELTNSLVKRLDVKRGTAAVKLSTIAVACLCSQGYVINHNVLPSITQEDMKRIWSYIETLSVSSSEKLSAWLKSAVGERSQDGYIAAHCSLDSQGKLESTSKLSYNFTQSQPNKNNLNRPVGKTSELDANVMSIYFGDTPTVNETVCADSIAFQHLRMCNGANIPTVVGYGSTARHDEA